MTRRTPTDPSEATGKAKELLNTVEAKLRDQIALAVAEANACEYCLAAHSTIGKMAGLTNGDVVASRQGRSSDPKATAALAFARAIVDRGGDVKDADFRAVREAGHGDAEISEIVAHNVFTNYFNRLVRTGIDCQEEERT